MRRWLSACAFVAVCCFPGWAGDRFASFYPAEVKTYGCKVEMLDVGPTVGQKQMYWIATAHAERNEQVGNWAMEIAHYSPNAKGRRKALMECANFMDEAEKQVRKVKQ